LKACDVPYKVVNRLCYTDRLTTFEKLSDALETGAISDIKGIGVEKMKKITNFIAKYKHVVKQNPNIAAVAINSEMVNAVNIISEMVSALNIELDMSNAVTLPHKSSIRSITTPVESQAAQAVSKPRTTRTKSENLSNRIESSQKKRRSTFWKTNQVVRSSK